MRARKVLLNKLLPPVWKHCSIVVSCHSVDSNHSVEKHPKHYTSVCARILVVLVAFILAVALRSLRSISDSCHALFKSLYSHIPLVNFTAWN